MSDYRLPDGTIPVLLSSDTDDGLRAEAAVLLAYLEQHPAVSPDRVADMIFRTRVARRRRALAMVTTHQELRDAVRSIATGAEHPAVIATAGTARAHRIGFIFPGQGSQRPGMGRVYYDCSPTFRAAIEECATIFEDRYGHAQPLHYLLGDEGRFEDTVQVVQPALLFQMTGLAAMWQAAGVSPAATIGHSQGELSAGAVSGVMTLRDSVLVVTHRAMLVDQLSPDGYSMAVLGMDREACEALLAKHSGWAELSVVNSPHILAISGDRATIVDAVATATARGQFAKEIRVAYPAHTSMVVEIGRKVGNFMGDELSSPNFAPAEIPCYGATLGELITPDLAQAEYWYWNLRNRVRFDRAIVAAATDGIDMFIEISEHPMLQLAVQENLTLVPRDPMLPPRDVQVIGTSRRTATGLGEFTRNVATVAVHDLNYRWAALRTSTTVSLPLRDFPATRMNPKKLWAPYPVDPAARVEPNEPPKPQRLVEHWERLDRRSLVPPRSIALIDHTGRCAELVSAMVSAADRHGATATAADAAAVDEFDTAVVLLPPMPETDSAGSVADITDFFATRAWAHGLPRLRPGTECWLVTVGGEAVVPNDPVPQLFHGSVSAGFRAVSTEYAEVRLRHLDLAATEAAAEQAIRIIGALHTAGEPELALRAGSTYVKRLRPDTSAPGAAADLEHVLIVGGTGQLGLRFCEHYVRAGAARITLLSRTGASEAVAGQLDRIRGLGTAEVVVTRCDISDAAAVRRYAEDSASRPVSLLIHAAVNYVDAELADITAEMVATAARSKLIGLDHVLAEVARTEACRVVLCSSFAATMGGRGQILYAVTNRMLDVTAHRLRAQGIDCVSLQWGLWAVVGQLDEAGASRVSSAGVIPMDPAAAIAAGLSDQPGDAVVCSADWSLLHQISSAYGHGAAVAGLVPAPSTAPPVEPATPVAAAAPAATAGAAPVATVAANAPSLATQMRVELEKVMGAADSDVIDGSVPLIALGLDSLQALDLRKRVQAELNRDLPVAAILGGASLDDVVRLMADSNV
ncbi:nocobactin polyketide synthase NbtC [Nocardia ninae]|uniref:Putative polyketide synthase MbtD n=1 Tax=Nocardia ninae NBRC 108245 TaxID=1210091 RepID=A0A511MAW4_9NOCA|nr:nocobactin polyketide synthase NbtC [Nocardia ninae]GEM37238.1 putative polyketide synthase MbtD [Nocardia ninae NBRC 108245]